ncbi:hypothetical protein L249_2556 [Ophiocordyceps polyrhachis-furcata BCC 54312]|uniref:Uncharacterized protein n=1 Tax=Ophiocordyceps polyrhachis-furcata BCC 54312 TaxID=1330021 RepID=A0A367LQN1_9HYPO|nr:hypothetical protein L249_2556 [Ophiocordyceps polyrhachis-furcata BCC 54312]
MPSSVEKSALATAPAPAPAPALTNRQSTPTVFFKPCRRRYSRLFLPLSSFLSFLRLSAGLRCTRPEGLGGSRDAGPAAAGPRPPYVTEAVRGGYGTATPYSGYGRTGRTGRTKEEERRVEQDKQGVPSSKIQSVSV